MKAITVLKNIAGERSRYRIYAEVKDLEGNIVVPDTLKWTLTNMAGDVINHRDQVQVVSPQASHPVIIYGADLALTESSLTVTRIFRIEATYTKDGVPGIPYKEEVYFKVRNFVGVGNTPVKSGLAMPDNLDMPADLVM